MKITKVEFIKGYSVTLHLARESYFSDSKTEYVKDISWVPDNEGGGVGYTSMDGNTRTWIAPPNIAFVEQKQKVICPDCNEGTNGTHPFTSAKNKCRLCNNTGMIDLDTVPAEEFTNTQT